MNKALHQHYNTTTTCGQNKNRPPMEHQKIAIETLRKMKFALLAYDMGLGKTKILINSVQLLPVPKAIVVTKAALLSHWKNECDVENISAWVVRGTKSNGSVSSISEFNECHSGILLMSFETITALVETVNRILAKPVQLIVDESHLITNPRAKRTWTLWKLRKSGVWLSTGTPIMNDVEDLFPTVTLLNVWRGTLADFRQEFEYLAYTITTEYGDEIDIWEPQDDALERLHRMLAPVTLRMTADHLKPTLYIRCVEFHEDPITVEKAESDCRLEELTNWRVAYADPDKNTARYELLLSLLETHAGNSVMIVTSFETVARRLSERLQDGGKRVGIISGNVPAKKRDEAVRRANAGELDVLLVVNAAGREGLNLPGVPVMVFWDGDWTDAGHRQVMDRIRRVTSRHPLVTVYELMGTRAPDSYLKRVRQEKATVERAFWDGVRLSAVREGEQT
ncbi:hypothetical protein CVV65_13595 [Kyrpidia spormannii]|uniref:DEAD/DEAH box helicase n=1 Tax=Kyrpidia spormannii TaxID=2055160 RepID=A0A2K8N958_9BACL|nr:DEAD/DEAH box helicase [Kyrpidia spormannii]ATY85833.1 hypothetical protein CVV65_13595 [Kyrpidia spormannii]